MTDKGASLVAMQEMWVQSLSWEDPLEEGIATHSSILAGKIPWAEELGRLWSMGGKESDKIEHMSTHKDDKEFSNMGELPLSKIKDSGAGNGCLEGKE